MPNLLPGAWRYLDETLKASGALTALVGQRIYEEAAPQEAVYPLVVASWAAESDLSTVGGDLLVAQPLYLVRAIVKDRNKLTLKQAADAIHAALAPPAGGALVPDVTLDGSVYAVRSWAETNYRRADFEQGVRFDSLGAYFRLFIEAV